MGREQGDDDFHSPELQERVVRGVIPGLKIVETVQDIDVSGTTFDRSGIDRIRELVEDGRVDVVAIHDLSRLGRNVLESLTFIRWLRNRGVAVVSAMERVDDTPEGQLMLVNLLAIHEYRSGDIGRRWAQIISHRAGRGQHHGTPPRGYLRGEDGHLVVDPVVGPAVTAAFKAYAAGVPVRQIRRDYCAMVGRHTATTALKRMLANPTYLGKVRVAGRRTGPVESYDAHPPLVDQETWDKVQRRLEADHRTPPRTLSPAYSLSGLGECGVCHRPTNIRRDSKGVPRLFCRNQWEATSPCPGCGWVTLPDAEEVVLDRVVAHIGRLRGNIAEREAQLAKAARAGADAAILEQELTRTREAMVRVARKWGLGELADDVYEQTMAGFRADEERLVAALATRRQEVDLTPQAVISLGEALERMWPQMDGGQRCRALREIGEKVVVFPASRYREPAHKRLKVIFR